MSFPRVDSHQHFTREYLPSLLLPILKRNRFDGTVVVARLPSVDENRWLLDLAANHDFIRGVVCWSDLSDYALLDEYQTHPKFRGVYCGAPVEIVGRTPGPRGTPPSRFRTTGSAACEAKQADEGVGRGPLGGSHTEPRPSGSDLFAELVRRDLTLDLPPNFALASTIAAQFPALRIAIDHVGRPSLMTEGPDELNALARHPNVLVKISGLITDDPTQWTAAQFAPWVRAAIAAFGAERVMFGSDWPSYLPVGTWKEALAAFTQAIGAQTIETREQLLGATARRFYRLGDDA